MTETTYLLVDATLRRGAVIDDDRLRDFTERHKLELACPDGEAITDPVARVRRDSLAGLILCSDSGLVDRTAVALLRQVLDAGVKAYVYWPREQALEVVDAERLRSYRVHLLMFTVTRSTYRVLTTVGRAIKLPQILSRLRLTVEMLIAVFRVARGTPKEWAFVSPHVSARRRPEAIVANAAPLPLPCGESLPSPSNPLPGTGVYLRLDFWAPLISGGSYGHTCYVAQNLAKSSEDFVCLMAQRYELLDEMGLRQVVLEPFAKDGNEYNLLGANRYYYQCLRTSLELLRPRFIYERICLGNHVGAALSQDLSIPYIVEYNGSELSMNRSFGAGDYTFGKIFELAELAAFRQATVISVVSAPIRDQLVALGIEPRKILVNPNGVDPQAYAPPPEDERLALRASLGFADTDRVVGFTGTFGGWHGIDVLAAAIPRVCEQSANARFLFIGTGNSKHLVDEAIAGAGLESRCVSVGRVPQTEGARLLGACDIFVAPHNAHMSDSRFFGSPTKIFEYMSMAGGVVASDLEQIGEILSPALTPAAIEAEEVAAGDARAVLCTPGDVDEFVAGVLALIERPQLCRALGENARRAVLEEHTWAKHVAKVWRFASESGLGAREEPQAAGGEAAIAEGRAPATGEIQLIDTGDRYKDEVQQQWNADACGSHYVSGVEDDTLAWYLEAERYRYEEYGPWMAQTMEFAQHAGEDVLEVGAGIGTDLAQFAGHGARTTDVDLSGGHLAHARRNFELRGLEGRFVHQDAEAMPFDDDSFDVVYSNGVIHHTPNTQHVVDEMWRVLRPGGQVIVMVYAENSYHYWKGLFFDIGVRDGLLETCSMGEIMSRSVELSSADQRPLVKVYTAKRLRRLFARFTDVGVVQRQLVQAELPSVLQWMDADTLGRYVGWNLVIKARKPARP